MLFVPTPPDKLLELAGKEILSQMRTASGASESHFQNRYLPKLKCFAEYVQQLPLQSDVYSRPLGALRFGITAAWLALRLADQVMFVQGTSHERRTLDPQYRLAAFEACLASTILLVNHNLIITVAGAAWSYLSAEPNLYKAAKLAGGYEVGWTRNARKPSAALGVLALARFFTTGQWSEHSLVVTADMCNSINPGCLQVTGETPLAKIVRQGLEKARELEIKSRAGAYEAPVAMPASALDLSALVGDGALSIQPASPSLAEPVVQQIQAPTTVPSKPSLSPELQAWSSYIRSNKEIQAALRLSQDGTLQFDTKYLQGAGLKAQDVYDWLRNAGFVVSQQKEPFKHLVLSSAIASELKVEMENA